MGSFYQSVHVRAAMQEVRRVLEMLCSTGGPQAWVGPTLDEWTTFFPDELNGPALAQQVSAQLKVPALLTLIHDSDVFCYILHLDGKPTEQFASPTYAFGEDSERPRTQPQHIFTLLSGAAQRDQLCTLLASEPPEFAEERLAAVLDLLGIKNGLSSYEYLERGEREGVAGWPQFVHLPDRCAEKERRKAERKARLAAKKAVGKDLLLFDSELMRKPKLPAKLLLGLHDSAPGSGEFLVSGFNSEHTLMRWNPPDAPTPIGSELPVEHGIPVLILDASRAVVSRRAGAAVVDLKSGRTLARLTNVRGLPLAYDVRSDVLYLNSDGRLLAIRLDGEELVFTTPLDQHDRHVRHAVLHPSEPHLLYYTNYWVGLMDTSTGERIVTLRAYNSGLREKKRAQWLAVSGHVPSEAAEVLEREDIFSLRFDPTGERVFGGTAEGLREYRYADLLRAHEQMPAPTGGIETSVELQDYRYVYSMIVDAKRSHVIFAGGDDSLRWYGWNDRTAGVLKPADEGRKIWTVQLNGDGSKLLCHIMPGSGDLLKRQDDHWVQVWNYMKLWAR